MTSDDKMREIEAALESLIDRAAVGRGVADQRIKVRDLIRAALPKPWSAKGDGTHECVLYYDGSGRADGCTFTMTDKDGKVTRFAPVQEPTNPVTVSSSCECSLRTRLVGDGCDKCNPVQADAEHEAKVEAWRYQATECRLARESGELSYEVTGEEIDEALRLMRARPTTQSEAVRTALRWAAELIRGMQTETVAEVDGLRIGMNMVAAKIAEATTEAGPSAVDALRHLQQIIYKRTPEQLDDEIGAMIEAAAKPGPSSLERLRDKIRSEADNADESYSAGLHRAADIIDEEKNNG